MVSVLGALVACGGTAPSEAPPRPARVTPPEAATSPSVDASEPDALVTACLMVNVCACNLGCASIRVPRDKLRDGTRADVVRGPLQGEAVEIVEVVDASGARVLSLRDLHHDHACSLTPDRAFFGYGCAAGKSGPVPAKACVESCEDDPAR